ncbi:MAG: lipase family protein [Acidaminococcales bacterium]|nr:lipase family protein [Acidaminococcales bacterium]
MPKKIVFKIVFLLVPFSIFTLAALAGPKEEYAEAALVYAAANASLAAYGDQTGAAFFGAGEGWEAVRPQNGETKDGRRIFRVQKTSVRNGQKIYIIAFRGTNSYKEAKTDLRINRVPFAGKSPDEIKINAGKRGVGEDRPKVHKGFLEYALAGFCAAGRQCPFYAAIKNNPQARLIVTGHSLGGAAAVLYAAVMAEMGVPQERIKVITFGAPAVGNHAFADKYKDRLDILRVYSRLDPVPASLALFPYAQLGRELMVKSDLRRQIIPHGMDQYADFAGKHYYDCRAKIAGDKDADPPAAHRGGKIVAALVYADDGGYGLETEYRYMRENLLDVYGKHLPRLAVLGAAKDGAGIKESAAAAGADYLLQALISARPVKTGKNKWIVTLSQSMTDLATGRIVAAASFNRQIKTGGSFFQASAYNAFRAAAQLAATDVNQPPPP